MSTETNVQQVKVNLMTQAQYDEATKNPNEFYVITDQDYITETELNNKGYLTEHQDISNLATKEELTNGLSDKQDVISDLETIRAGASKGSTALQSVPSEYITETELESKGYLTNIPSEYITETELNNKGYLTEHQDISGKQDILTQNAQATGSAISLVSNSNYYTIKPTSATTFTFPSVSAGKVYTFELKVTLSSVYSLTFPSSVVWMNGEAPDMSEAGVYFLVFRTDDGGNTWYGNSQGRWSI